MIVKIYSKIDNTVFGSGFIVGVNLFTAAHVFLYEGKITYDDYYFVFENIKFEFINAKIIFIEYISIDEYTGKEDFFNDLAIFDISNYKLSVNKFEFSHTPIKYNEVVITNGFSNSGDTYDKFESKVTFSEYAGMGVGTNGGMGCFKNCFKIDKFVAPGNSGGPVFYKDLVVGMIVAGNESGIKAIIGTSILKTDYILNCISNI